MSQIDYRTNCAIARAQASIAGGFLRDIGRKNMASEIWFVSEADIGILLVVSVFYLLQLTLESSLIN